METVSGDAAFLAHLGGEGEGQLVKDHLLAVSQAAMRHSQKAGIGKAGAAIGLLHDLGKYSLVFQRYLRQMALTQDTEEQTGARGTVDHSTAGAQTVWRRLKAQGARDGAVGEILALCIASHHSGLIDCIAPDGVDNLSRRMKKADAETHHDEAWLNADHAIVEGKENLLNDSALAAEVAGVIERICEKDSNETIRRFKAGLLGRLLFSCLIDADRTDTADAAKAASGALRQHGRYVPWATLVARLEEKLAGFQSESSIDLLRREVAAECLSASLRPKGIHTLTVPTGGGKTLASLRFALNHAAKWGMDRIIYVSPYTSIIDQNAEVVRQILEPSGSDSGRVVLEHHSNLTPLQQTWRSKVLSENWDAPVVFTTAVQLLEALFGSGTRAVRRMHQLANAVLVFDEVQTLPVRCVHLFNNALNFMTEQCGSSAVLCTATQPLLHQVDPAKGAIRLVEGAEIMPDLSGLFSRLRRNEVLDARKAGGWEHGEAAALAAAESERAGSCLVVVNTKREARSIFLECKALGGIPVVHLSTNMCPAHRSRKLKTIKSRLKRRAPVICVSTQLIEAGVDISFGAAIRALAGLDSIAQAAGRCNRHGEDPSGRVHIINLKGSLPTALKDIRLGQEAAQRVLDESAASDPSRTIDLADYRSIEQYFRYYFFDRRQEMDYPVSAGEAERDDTLLNMLGENKAAVSSGKTKPAIYLRQAFMTAAKAFQAIDANTQGVIVPYTIEAKNAIGALCGAHEPEKQFELLRQAQRFTVNVFPHLLKKLQKDGGLHEVQEGTGILYLEKRYYSNEFGLNEGGTEEMEGMFA